MAEFDRTEYGIRNTSLFYHGQLIVWVEGKTDKAFWALFFPSSHKGKKLHMKPAGGKPNALRRAHLLRCGDAHDYIVAIDSDYDDISGSPDPHPLIVETGRYSIENFLLDSAVLNKALATLCPDYDPATDGGAEWDSKMEEFGPLLYADYTSHRLQLGICVMGDNCTVFLRDNPKGDWRPDPQKIAAYIGTLPIPDDEIAASRAAFENRRPVHYIRGHFLEASAQRLFLRNLRRFRGRKASCSSDNLRDHLIMACAILLTADPDLHDLQSRTTQALRHLSRQSQASGAAPTSLASESAKRPPAQGAPYRRSRCLATAARK